MAMSREEMRRKRELDEARKAGELPPEQDAAGNLINPHIPEFMAKAPWYLNQQGPGLAHQKKAAPAAGTVSEGINTYVRRGEFAGQATTYRKGACKNCGAMSHNEKDCVERPRRVGAWKTGSNIAPDEVVVGDLALGWEAKRDRYNGYDPAEHQRTVERFQVEEAERRRVREELRVKAEQEKAAAKAARAAAKEAARAAKRAAKAASGGGSGSGGSVTGSDADSVTSGHGKPDGGSALKLAVAADGGGSVAPGAGLAGTAVQHNGNAAKSKVADGDAATDSGTGSGTDTASDTDTDTDTDYDSTDDSGSDADVRERDSHAAVGVGTKRAGTAMKMTVRNLRVREDTAKYLRNLDVDSAYYDPKTRSMRENPNPHLPDDVNVFQGDNAWRARGGAVDVAQAQLFAWEAYERGAEVHLQANPTQAQLYRQQVAERKEALRRQQEEKLRERYGTGGAEAVSTPGTRALLMGTTEAYVEYTRDGRVAKGATAAPARSKYEEDVHPGNHKSVWGSWYDKSSGAWGFACCHSTIFNSYCTGAAGIAAQTESEARLAAARTASAVAADNANGGGAPAASAERAVAAAAAAAAAAAHTRRSDLYGENLTPVLDQQRLADALRRYDAQHQAGTQQQHQQDGRGDGIESFESRGGKRKYHSLGAANVGVSVEDMEAYKLKRTRGDDPMANYGGGGGGGGGVGYGEDGDE